MRKQAPLDVSPDIAGDSRLDAAIPRAILALRNIVDELQRKEIDFSRIAKTSSLLLWSGVSPNSIPPAIYTRCVSEQKADGGWTGVDDTMWCTLLLSSSGSNHTDRIETSLRWLKEQRLTDFSWGRSARDMGRIPVTGALFYFLPQLADKPGLNWLEQTWKRECYSITYKAAYTLMAFRRNDYQPTDAVLIRDTAKWLAGEQREDGGFAPWKEHPVGSNVLCTSIAILGLLQYPEFVEDRVLGEGLNWLVDNQLRNGLWSYHQIEDGSSWGLYALAQISKFLAGNRLP